MSATELDQWVTAWCKRQPGPSWPRDPGIHTKEGATSWHQGAAWWYSGRVWYLRLVPGGVLFGQAWALGLLDCVPASHMPLVTRDLGDRWVVQLLVDGREVRVAHQEPGTAVGLALREAYDGRDGR